MGTKNSLAMETGLSVATCGNLLSGLIQNGMAAELEAADSTGGRPSRRFSFNREYAYILTVFPRIEGEMLTLNYAIADMLGGVIEQGSRQHSHIGLSELESLLDSLIGIYQKVAVLSVGIPGVIWNYGIGSCDFESFEGVDLQEHLSARYKINTVVENDVNTAAFGYYHQNCGREACSLAYIYYPEGHNPGAGIIIDGKIIRGASNFAGEIGWLPEAGQEDSSGKIANAVIAVNCIINPEQIIISGIFLDREIVDKIRENAALSMPEGHLPSIVFEKDFRASYSAGLIHIGLEKYSESLKDDIAFLQENL